MYFENRAYEFSEKLNMGLNKKGSKLTPKFWPESLERWN